jgi:hypothetical protein
MAYDDYLNKDKGLRGGVMDAPDRQVRIAQAKIAAGAAHLLTAKEWNRIAERQRLEQESLPMAMTASEQANRARAAMNVGRPRFTAEELLAANQPGTVPAPDEFVVRNIPGRGESTMVRGVPIVGGPMRSGELPTPDEGYGYVMGPSGYISTTPYGMQRGQQPVLSETVAADAAIQQPINPPAFDQQPTAGSQFEQQLAKPPVSMATGMKSIEELLPSLKGTPQRANETVADVMRGAFYGATNVMRPSMWTGTTTPSGAAAAIYTPEKSPEYLNQLTSRLDAMSDKTSPRAVSLQNEINRLSQATPAAPMTTDVLGISQAKPKMTADMVASQILGPSISKPQVTPATQPTENGMTVSAVIPQGVTGQTELATQAYEQPPMEQVAQPTAQFQTYRPPELKIQPFNVGQIMKQPSVSETLAMGPALKAYQAQTQAQIAAYKANVQAQRNAVNDSINAQVKALNLRKGEADLLKTQLANQYAVGGPSTGVTKVGNKNVGFFQDGPNSFKLVELDPKISAFEQNLKIRQDAYANVSRLISSGDDAKAMEAFTALTGRPENFAAFKLEVQSANQPVVEQPKPKQTTSKQTAKTTEVLGGKYKVTELK